MAVTSKKSMTATFEEMRAVIGGLVEEYNRCQSIVETENLATYDYTHQITHGKEEDFVKWCRKFRKHLQERDKCKRFTRDWWEVKQFLDDNPHFMNQLNRLIGLARKAEAPKPPKIYIPRVVEDLPIAKDNPPNLKLKKEVVRR